MRIGFDLRRIGNPGVGRYMQCIVDGVIAQAPTHEYVLIMAPGTEHMISGNGQDNVTTVATTLPYYSVREQFVLPSISRKYRLDLFHSPHFLMPLMPACPTIVTIHDVIHIACKGDMDSGIGRLYANFMLKAAAHRACRIITVSEFSKADIVRLLFVNADNVDVVLSGVDERFKPIADSVVLRTVVAKYGGATKPFILYTGIYKLRKNHIGLLRAFAKVRHSGVDLQLLIAGPLKEGEVILKKQAAELGIADDVIFGGHVEDADLPALYSAARVYACPSTYEGFGFTILEAMACGTPVVCNPSTSLPEVGNDAPLWADSQSPDQFAEALVRASTDEALRADLINKGFKNVERFRWDNAVRETIAVYERALGRSMGPLQPNSATVSAE